MKLKIFKMVAIPVLLIAAFALINDKDLFVGILLMSMAGGIFDA